MFLLRHRHVAILSTFRFPVIHVWTVWLSCNHKTRMCETILILPFCRQVFQQLQFSVTTLIDRLHTYNTGQQSLMFLLQTFQCDTLRSCDDIQQTASTQSLHWQTSTGNWDYLSLSHKITPFHLIIFQNERIQFTVCFKTSFAVVIILLSYKAPFTATGKIALGL